MNRLCQLWLPAFAVALFVAGCRGIPTASENEARHDLASVSNLLQTSYSASETNATLEQILVQRLHARQIPFPALPTNATLRDAVSYALRNHPQVTAAYSDWAASVENITLARSLPDPKLTFELYVGDILNSLMPGLEADFPGPGKLSTRAAVASAESRAKYFQFESVALQRAFAVEKSFYPLHFLDAKLAVNRQSLALLASLETLARAQNEVGRATLQDVLRAQIEQEKLKTETANLEDSRRVLLAQYKAALGFHAGEPDPPVPAEAEFTEIKMTDDELFAAALKQNPRLKELEAEIKAADAGIRVAQKEKVPDFTAGGRVDLKANPLVWNPQLSMTLPIWRDKLAAELAAAQAGKRAAEARLSAEQINLAVDFAEQTYLIREANRELTLLRERLLPRARQSLDVSRAAYRSGQVDFLNVIDAERSLLNFQLDEIAAQSQREIARAELTLLVAGVPPENAPLLKASAETAKPAL